MPLVELLNIRKRFGPLAAIDGVSLSLASGRVHGLLGENGAGKSTLMNILYGMLRPDAGQIRIDGRPAAIARPRDAIALGLGMVHQHFMLAGAMTVLDNILLGDRRQGAILNRSAAAGSLRKLIDRLQLDIDLASTIDRLSVGQQQRVEILKALYRDVHVLILDEPTAVLTPHETEQLFAAVRRLREQGKSIVFISHKLREVKEICDDLTVLRRGRVVWQGPADSVTPAELAAHMVGHEVPAVGVERAALGEPTTDARTPAASAQPAPADLVLELDHATARGLHDVSLRLPRGRILGIAGVDGNGQQQLAETIVGLLPLHEGALRLGGRDAGRWSAKARREWGVAHIPNDRHREGLVTSMSIAQNIALKRHDAPPFSLAGVMRWRTIRRAARSLVEQFGIRAPSVDVPVASLSGGNQQKVVLARELALAAPRLIVAMNPARGLDVAAAAFVYDQLLQRRRDGAAVLLISSELDELLALCDQIAVLYNSRLTMSDFPQAGPGQIGRMMTGTAVDRA